MNRLVTAAAADVATPKVFLAQRVIKSVAPTAKVKAIVTKAQSKEALDALKGVDIVFGCVDNDGARLILNELSQAFCIPFFDVAVGIEVEDGNVTVAGGRVVAVMPGGPCLLCCGEIDADEARFFLNDPKEQAFQLERGYVQGAEVTAPSVVSVNGSIASTAVNEFAVFVSGVRPVQVFTELDLIGLGHPTKGQRLALRRVTSDPHCVACTVRGLGDRAGIDRYTKVS